MSDGASILEATWAALADKGANCVLTRISGRNGATRVSVTVKGRLINATNDPLLGGELGQTGRLLIISDKEIAANHWPGPPVDHDEVSVSGSVYTVEYVKTYSIGELPVRHELYLKG